GAAEIVQADADEFLVFVTAQRVQPVLEIRAFVERAAQFAEHFAAAFFDAREIGADQGVDQLRPIEKQIGQKLAVGEKRGEQAQRVRVFGEQGEKPGAPADAVAEASEIRERLVRRAAAR